MQSSPEGPLSLAADFPSVTVEDWLESVDGVLKGAPFDKRLISRTRSGVPIEPLYDGDAHAVDAASLGAPGSAPWVRGSQSAAERAPGWDIRPRHDLDDPATTNAAILADLEQGATSILLRFRRRPQMADLRRALQGVFLGMATIALDAGPWAPDVAPMIAELWDEQGVAVADRRAALRIDPLGAMARFGAGMPESLGSIASHTDSPHVTTMAVDATPYTDGGASDALELALSLATGTEYLRWMTSAGMPVDEAAAQIEFTYAASADQFATIAKLRAARLTWGRIIEASGGTAGGQTQHAITSAAMFSQKAPWVNLLRATTAAFSAATGGAQSITVLPFDTALGQPVEVARRTARNIGLLLMEEAHVGAVIDPAGGSWFVEDLTDSLAEAAWVEFQKIEAQGGMHASLVAGLIQERVEEDWDELATRLATRKDALIGVSEFPDLGEVEEERASVAVVGRFDLDPAITPIPLRRHSAPFEELREDAAEAQAKITVGSEAEAAMGGADIFVAALGPPAVHSARLGFASNFFAVGGVRAVLHPDNPNGFEDPEEAAEAFARSGLTAAVICSSDKMYGELASETAAALKGAGCYQVYLAGNPGENRAVLQRSGVDEFIHLGTDVLATLQGLHEFLGYRRVS